MKKYTAYSIFCEQTGMRYIGITCNSLKNRLKTHRGVAADGRDHPLYNDVRVLGWQSMLVQEIASCKDYEAAQELERLLISAYNCLYPNGYNLETGGNLGKRASAYTKKRLSDSHKGFKQTPETLAKRAIAMAAAYDANGGALRKARSAQSLGTKHSEEWNRKIGFGNSGKVRTPELKDHLANTTAAFAELRRVWAAENSYTGPLNRITRKMLQENSIG